jgi:phosphatidylserine synthase
MAKKIEPNTVYSGWYWVLVFFLAPTTFIFLLCVFLRYGRFNLSLNVLLGVFSDYCFGAIPITIGLSIMASYRQKDYLG